MDAKQFKTLVLLFCVRRNLIIEANLELLPSSGIGGTKQITQLIGAFAYKHTFLTSGRGARNRSDLRFAVLIATLEFTGQEAEREQRKREQRTRVLLSSIGINRALSLASTDLQRSQIDNLLNKMSNLIFA
jgi:hypothetical protein